MTEDVLNNLDDLELHGGDSVDSKLTSYLANTDNQLLSQLGKQLGKADETTTSSLGKFATNQGDVKMRSAFDKIGSNAANTLNDDTWKYLNGKASSMTPKAATLNGSQIINAAANNTNEKVTSQISEMMAVADANEMAGALSAKNLASLSDDNLGMLAFRVEASGTGSRLYQDFIRATNDIANSPELMSNLRRTQRDQFKHIRSLSMSGDTTFD